LALHDRGVEPVHHERAPVVDRAEQQRLAVLEPQLVREPLFLCRT